MSVSGAVGGGRGTPMRRARPSEDLRRDDDELPVDEAVPMIFRMGTDETVIKTFLKNGNDFREPLCRRSYGISVDEPVAMNFERRQYIFNVRAWTVTDVLTFQPR